MTRIDNWKLAGQLLLCVTALGCSDDDKPDAGKSDAGKPDGGAAADSSMSDAAAAGAQLCSGCPTESRAGSDNTVHFHHAHLNTVDPEATFAFYERYFGTTRTTLNGHAEVIEAGDSLMLLNEVAAPPDATLDVSLQHVGFDRVDVRAWYDSAAAKNVPVDNRTSIFDGPLALFPGFDVIYVEGPSGERVEIETGSDEELAHVHLMTPDVNATVAWYEALLDKPAEQTKSTSTTVLATYEDGEVISLDLQPFHHRQDRHDPVRAALPGGARAILGRERRPADRSRRLLVRRPRARPFANRQPRHRGRSGAEDRRGLRLPQRVRARP